MHVHATMLFMMRTVFNIFLWIFHNKVNSKDIVWYYCNCPHRDFAQKAKSREGTLVTHAYIKESTLIQLKYTISMLEKISICLNRGREESVGNDDISIVCTRKYKMVTMT